MVMKSRFVKELCPCILLVGYFLAASPTLHAKSLGTLRLNLDGPFVICEETATLAGNTVPVLRVLVPTDPDHDTPAFVADSSAAGVADSELAPGSYNLNM